MLHASWEFSQSSHASQSTLFEGRYHLFSGHFLFLFLLLTHFNSRYVKREIRTLTVSDRERFLDAAAAVWKYSQTEGTEMFGSKFTSIGISMVKMRLFIRVIWQLACHQAFFSVLQITLIVPLDIIFQGVSLLLILEHQTTTCATSSMMGRGFSHTIWHSPIHLRYDMPSLMSYTYSPRLVNQGELQTLNPIRFKFLTVFPLFTSFSSLQSGYLLVFFPS